MAKLKQFHLTHSYRGVELTIICVTNSKKRFAELMDMTVGYIGNYANFYDPRDIECIENVDVVYAKGGIGGEAFHILNQDEIKPLSEYHKIIDEHRKIYATYRDYDEIKRNDKG